MKRTILYYPTIQIKSSKWIKHTILYWDCVGSIVPYDFDFPEYCVADMLLLREYDAYRPYHPEDFIQQKNDLAQEFEAIRQSQEFQSLKGGHVFERRDFRIFLPKIGGDLADLLLSSGAVDRDGDWLLFTQREGMLYMSLLAKYLSDKDQRSSTIPGTDWDGYQTLAYAIPSSGALIPTLSLKINKVLPVPREDISLKVILAFKQKRRDELLEVRKLILDVQKQLQAAESVAEIQSHLASFSENIELGVSNIRRLAEEDKVSTVLGSIESVFSMSLPDVVSLAAGATIDPTVAAVGMVGSGSVKVSKYLIDKTNERRRRLAKDGYAYIYYLQEEGIIDHQ
jgi:Family of unknown function (DUF6236)